MSKNCNTMLTLVKSAIISVKALSEYAEGCDYVSSEISQDITDIKALTDALRTKVEPMRCYAVLDESVIPPRIAEPAPAPAPLGVRE